MRRARPINLPAPYLRRVELRPEKVADWAAYPFCLPIFRERAFEIAFTHPGHRHRG
jgi:predicted ATPase